MPRFLESEHQVASAEDADAWMARVTRYPAVLDGELERMRSARGLGLLPPGFLIGRAIAQLEASVAPATCHSTYSHST